MAYSDEQYEQFFSQSVSNLETVNSILRDLSSSPFLDEDMRQAAETLSDSVWRELLYKFEASRDRYQAQIFRKSRQSK